MATIPTQNAVPSEAPRDLKFNSGKIDEFVTSLEHEYKDRFGRCHMTIEGMRWIFEQLMERFKVDINQAIIAAGYIPMDSFQQGAEITKRNEILRDETTGEYYRWDGDLPKSVPAGSTPESSGGVGMGAWVGVGDASLRSELHGDDGYKLIPSMLKHVQIQQWREQGDIRGWGAIEGEDCSEALQAAINERAAKDWGTSATVVINGSYRVDKQILIPTDLRLKGNWATITSDMDDYIFISGYVDGSGELVSNWDLSDEDAVATARLKGTTITGITFVDCAKVFKLRNFNERCGMSDLFFERCGVAWFAVSSFYSFFNNIFIRSTKTGYEDWYAFTFGRMTNLVDLFKVSITQRKYGEYYGDKNNNYNNYYELITHRQCSWEHVNRPITIDMKGFSFNIIDWYAEVISGPMIKVESGEQYDMRISRPSWLAGVENMGEFKNLKGRSEIYQGVQNDYLPPKPASLFFENSYCEVMTAERSDYGDRINYTQDCSIRYIRPFNEMTTPLTNGEFTTNSHGSVAKNINQKNYISHSSGNVYIKTDIKFTKHNMLIASIDLNYFNCGFVFYGDVFVNKYGYDFFVYSDADGYVEIKIENTGLKDSDQVFIEGCVRYI